MYNTLISNFNKAVQTYEKCAFIQQRMAEDLLERLLFFKINPNTILNLGCGLGALSHSITKRYPQSTLLNLDFAEQMLTQGKRSQHLHRPILADAHYLPFKGDSVELIISNAMLPWSYDLRRLFSECKRVLKDEGLFLFTTFGPETLQQWQIAWQKTTPSHRTINDFIDMHDIAEALIQVGFSPPVMDKETVEVHYRSIDTLIHDLKGMGSTLTHPNRYRGLRTSNQWRKMKANYPCLENKTYPLTWEIIHGHCFNALAASPKHQEPFVIPVGNITRRFAN